VFSQYIPFYAIHVTTNVDSLESILRNEKEPYRKLGTLLSIEKSNGCWNRETLSPHLLLLDSLCQVFPEMKGHLFYFKAKYESLIKNNAAVFGWSRRAYESYVLRKDTTGMIGALTLMGVATVNVQLKKNLPPAYGKKYFIQAYKLSQKTKQTEAELGGKYALICYHGIELLPHDIEAIIQLGKEGMAIISQNKRYDYFVINYCNALSIACERKGEYKLSEFYLTHGYQLLLEKKREIPFLLLHNLAVVAGKQKKYNLMIHYCRLALAHSESRASKNTFQLLTLIKTYLSALKYLKKYEEMALWLDSMYMYTDKYRQNENDGKVSEWVTKYEALEKEKQKKILEQQVRFTEQNIQIFIIIGSFFFVGMVSLGLLLRRLAYKNSRLEKALAEIQRFSSTRDFFMGILVHDLRRPLSSLHGMAETVDFYLKTERYDELKKVSLSIDRSGAKIRKLLDNTLHWVMSQEGRYEPESVHPANEIQSVLELYAQSILNQQIKTIIHCPTSLSVFADRNGLALILRNLIDNALKHLPAHGELSIQVTELASGNAQIRIEDNGKGIMEEKLREIRYILTHADELIPGQVGRSLGMLLVGRFIKINQGAIEVESQWNAGTVFTITLPLWTSENRKESTVKRKKNRLFGVK
jgi:signal transduction histidine kinase